MAFDRFMDHAVARLSVVGLDDTQALEVIFTMADLLTEEGALPPFPDDTVPYAVKGGWLVEAVALDFISFVVDAVETA